MTTVGAIEARNDLPTLLEKVQAGETVVITRDGKPIAHLVPATPTGERPDVAALIERWRESRKGLTLGGLKVRDLINEGRAGGMGL